MKPLLDRLRDQGCDRQPFTPEHADCICRLTNAAADEIERLRTYGENMRLITIQLSERIRELDPTAPIAELRTIKQQ